eukprot:11795571-Alexandrium_andersonii.AAC.1
MAVPSATAAQPRCHDAVVAADHARLLAHRGSGPGMRTAGRASSVRGHWGWQSSGRTMSLWSRYV